MVVEGREGKDRIDRLKPERFEITTNPKYKGPMSWKRHSDIDSRT